MESKRKSSSRLRKPSHNDSGKLSVSFQSPPQSAGLAATVPPPQKAQTKTSILKMVLKDRKYSTAGSNLPMLPGSKKIDAKRSIILNHIESDNADRELDLVVTRSKPAEEAASLKGSIDEDDEEGGKDLEVPVSYIDPRTIRWVNKRRHHAVQHTNNRISSQRLKQLKEIYNGFEVDSDGTLHLGKFRQAAEYVETNGILGEAFLTERPDLADIFHAYDVDKNGSIDFHEFVAGMTSDTSDQDLLNKHQAFFEIATKHRRQQIIDKLSNENVGDDSIRYRSFNKLFSVKFFRTDHLDSILEDGHGMTSKSNVTANQKIKRNSEVTRAREASLALKSDKQMLKQLEHPSKRVNTETSFIEPQRPNSSIFDHTSEDLLPLPEQDRVNKKLSNFAIPSGTFVPKKNDDDAGVKRSIQLRMQVTREAGDLLRHSLSLPPLR